jgi:hypothetical protein
VKESALPEVRYEIKFAGSELLREQLRFALRTHPAGFRIAYPSRQVNNVYFDTYNYDAYWDNLAGASVRTKVRYRWYGDSLEPICGALELKDKRNLLGWKRTYKVDESPYVHDARWRVIQEKVKDQLPEEGRQWLDTNPQPVLINSYLRAYFISSDERIRVTLDWNQAVWDQRFSSCLNLKKRGNMPRTVVLEIKGSAEDRKLAAHVLQDLPVRISRFSKYVVGVQAVSGT